MTWHILAQYVLFLVIVGLPVKPLGSYMERVLEGRPTLLDPLWRLVERALFRLAGIDPSHQMDWKEYATSFVVFGALGTLSLYAILRAQPLLPYFDPLVMTTPLTGDLIFNTAISFATTRTWQAYGGETTMSYTSQMVGLTAQNFLARAAGLAFGIAFIRGAGARERTAMLGNFWVDLTRALLYILLPIALVEALILVWQGVPMNWNAHVTAVVLPGDAQIIARGPEAAHEFMKNLGTNGGGFFNVNGAHPYENPTWLTNLLEMLAIVALPAALIYTFGIMAKRPIQGWVLFWVMMVLLLRG